MATQGRKNVHGKAGVRFKAPYDSSKKKSELRNLVTELIVHGRVSVTSGMGQSLKSLADRLVTYAKANDLHHRRLAAAVVRPIVIDEKTGKTPLDKLFDEIGPSYKERQGGYTRSLKLANRQGDNAPMVIVEFVK
jgi:large subunit ribosomal protein L17